MLRPSVKEDLHSYQDYLKLPEGSSLEFAICLTYSLDLDALIGACLALGLDVDPDSELGKDEKYLFSALDEVRDKIFVFCEKGRIRDSGRANPLSALMENAIVEVDLEGAGYPSFHPKLWILSYVDQNDRRSYRVVVLSRNLTLDDSWDVAGSLECKRRGSGRRASFAEPFSTSFDSLIAQVRSSTPSSVVSNDIEGMGKALKILKDDLPYLYFTFEDARWSHPGLRSNLTYPDDFPEGMYAPLLCSGHWANEGNGFEPVILKTIEHARRLLIMTPFLSSDAQRSEPFRTINRQIESGELDAEQCWLITRRDALQGQHFEDTSLRSVPLYAICDNYLAADDYDGDSVKETSNRENSTATPGEESRDDRTESGELADTPRRQRDIHAKLYLMEETATNHTHLFFGSANATRRGLETNDELMVHLISKEEDPTLFDSVLEDLGLDESSLANGSLFCRLEDMDVSSLEEVETDVDDIDESLRHVLRRLRARMTIRKRDDDRFDVIVKLDSSRCDPKDMRGISISSYHATAWQPYRNRVTFTSIELEHLSQFIRIKKEAPGGQTRQGIVTCVVEGGMKILERRRSALFQRYCAADDRSLIEYLIFRLSPNPEYTASLAWQREAAHGLSELSLPLEGLFDSLLRAYSNDSVATAMLVKDCLACLEDAEGDGNLESVIAMLKAFQQGDADV